MTDKTEPAHMRFLRSVGSIIAWVFIWPLSMIPFGVAVLIVLGLIASLTLNGRGVNGVETRTYIFVYGVTMALICAAIAYFIGKSKRNFLRKGRGVLIAYAWAGVILCGLVASQIPDLEQSANADTRQAASIIVPELVHDSTIIERMKEVGVNDQNAFNKSSQQYVDQFSSTDMIIPDQQGVFLSYTNPIDRKFSYGELKIKKGLSVNDEKRIIAHEYLHYVWSNTIAADTQYQDRLTSDLITMYGSDAGMQERVKAYSETQHLQPTELFAYYCTESSDRYLSSYVLGECGKYINRNSLIFQR